MASPKEREAKDTDPAIPNQPWMKSELKKHTFKDLLIMMHGFRLAAAAAAVSLLLSGTAYACTTLLVGSGATSDGSLIISRNADSNALKAQHMVVHPAKTNQKGMYRTADHHGANNFEYPLPKNSLRYTTVPNWKTGVHGATGFNSAGVGVSGTESIFARDDALKLDPYVEKTGITEDDIMEVILPRARSAREGAQILGHVVETKGAGEGFGVAFVDAKELWYLETGTGHQWIAVRIPKDEYFASGNQGRLQQYKAGDPNFMGSPTVVSWAEQHGFYNPKDGAFNFAKAYTRDDGRDRLYNDPRVFSIMKTLTPSLSIQPEAGRAFPVFAKPAEKVSVDEVKKLLRSHFEIAGLESHDPYTKGLRGDEPYRPISVFRTYESHVMQVRPNLPRAIGEVTYLAMGMGDLGVYVPFYQGLKAFPKEYSIGTDKADSNSAYWKFRKVQTLAMTDYPKLAPVVHERYAAWEADTAEKMKAFEAQYLKTVKTNPKKADQMLQDFNLKVIRSAEAATEALENELYTIRTTDIQKQIFFSNNKKKD